MSAADSSSRPIAGPEDGPPCRRFTILDGMAFVAATAICLLGIRATLGDVSGAWERLRERGLTPLSRPDMWAVHVYAAVVGSVGILTVTFLVIRLRRPRPTLRQLIRQPGMMACTIIVAYIPMLSLFTSRRSGPLLWLTMSASVAAAWIVTWWCGRLRPEPGWIDRFGRVLGACWIAFAGYPLLLLYRG